MLCVPGKQTEGDVGLARVSRSMIDELEISFGFRSLPCTCICHLSFTLIGVAHQRKQRVFSVSTLNRARPFRELSKLEYHDNFPDSHSEDSHDCSLQLTTHTASKSRSSTPKGTRGPPVTCDGAREGGE